MALHSYAHIATHRHTHIQMLRCLKYLLIKELLVQEVVVGEYVLRGRKRCFLCHVKQLGL